MFSVALLLLLAAGSCVKCEQLTQPGQRLTITCQVSYSVSDYYTAWIRQPTGKGLEWIGMAAVGSTTYYKDSLKNKFSISLDSSSKTVTLNGQTVQPEDTAVYYCAKGWGHFDYWGSGTEVTVTDTTTSPPTLFPLVQCNPGAANLVTVGCLAQDFYPNSLTFQWTDASGTTLTAAEQFPPTEKNNKYTRVSSLKVPKSEWDSRRPYSCSVTHPGGPKTVELLKAPSAPPSPTIKPPVPPNGPAVKVELKQVSSVKEIFSNNQAKLKCIVTGQDQNVVNQIKITWQINGNPVINNITPTQSGVSTMTLTRTEWMRNNNVGCSATKDDMTLASQDLTIRKGDGSEPKVTVHILPDEDIIDDVTLVCLVSNPVQQDYYIAWSEHIGQNTPIYTDGINLPPVNTQQRYSVASIYTTTKEKWKKSTMFSCHVWPGTGEKPTISRNVSNAMSNSIEYFTPESNLSFALSCTDDAFEEEEYSSLWSTAFSFIILFISSLLYSMIFSLVKMKRT